MSECVAPIPTAPTPLRAPAKADDKRQALAPPNPKLADLKRRLAIAISSANYPEVMMLAMQIEGITRPPRIDPVGVDGVFAPLPPLKYISKGLDLCPGPPALIAGYGYSGKTMLCQDMALCVAAGIPIWGSFGTTQGKVLHLDWEQGTRLTYERYQRLAAARQLHPDDLRGRLDVACLPEFYIDSAGAEDTLCGLLDGVTLCVIDSFRAAAPGVDENSSAARQPLDMLNRVSEKTGCLSIVIHHARKPTQGAPGGAAMSIRGSAAIFDGCGSVFVVEAEKGKQPRLSQHKAKFAGKEIDDLLVNITDLDMPGEPVRGLAVSVEQAPPAGAESGTSRGRLREQILTLAQDGFSGSRNELAKLVGGKKALVLEVANTLIGEGLLCETGDYHNRKLTLA